MGSGVDTAKDRDELVAPASTNEGREQSPARAPSRVHRTEAATRWWQSKPEVREPKWWIRDVVIAAVLGIVLLLGQARLDDIRSEHELEIAQSAEDAAMRRANLAFVRERAGIAEVERPFLGMDLKGQNMAGLVLVGADFKQASLDGASFQDGDLSNAVFSDTSMRGTSFVATDLVAASFDAQAWREYEPADKLTAEPPLCARKSNCVDFVLADLTDAIFHGDFRGSDFAVAYFHGTDLREADLRWSNFEGAVFEEVCWDDSTLWPEGYEPPGAPWVSCKSTAEDLDFIAELLYALDAGLIEQHNLPPYMDDDDELARMRETTGIYSSGSLP